IRGPDYRGEVPKKLKITCPRWESEIDVDKETRAAKIALAESADGWCEIAAGAARSRLYVKPEADLTVTVTPGAERYKPGAEATLALRTTSGGRGTAAAVGLFGVDESL